MEIEWIVLLIMIAIGDLMALPSLLYYIKKLRGQDTLSEIKTILEDVKDGAEHLHVEEVEEC